MDVKKIGGFLKKLRREKGLTQEQAAEKFGVSGRTVSRWETGSNMPDLSILIQIADYYEVEVKEILDGERKGTVMDREVKETLLKVADYSELEKEKVSKAGNTAFGVMFIVCAAVIMIQLIFTNHLSIVLGETAVLLLGGISYITIMVKNGVWEAGSKIKSTPKTDAKISILCSALFSALFLFLLAKLGVKQPSPAVFAGLFFAGTAIAGFAVLRMLAIADRKKQQKF